MSARERRRPPAARRATLLITILLVAAACGGPATPASTTDGSPGPGASAAAVEPSLAPTFAATFALPSFSPAALRWFCCPSTGADPAQQSVEQAVATKMAHVFPGSSLKLEVDDSGSPMDALRAQIRGANPPDIVGPIGLDGVAALHGQWLDLGPFVAAGHLDLGQFDPGAVSLYQGPDGQIGVPFDISPSMLWYQKDMFAAAGLAQPPHRFGDRYAMPDGTVVDWSTDTLARVARLLTLDDHGRNATDPAFDRDHIIQYGFEPQRDDLRSLGAFWGAGNLTGPDGKTVVIPDAWKAAWRFFYDGMWGAQPFIMTGQVLNTDPFNGGDYAFFSGKVAMSENFLWSSYGVAAAGTDWDLAAIPSFRGLVTAPTTADTFAILKTSRHPAAAFAMLTNLVGDASDQLLRTYASMPARAAKQDAFLAQLGQTDGFPAQVDWQVARDSLSHAATPNYAAFTPQYDQTVNILDKYLGRWTTTPGLSMDTEFDNLAREIQAQWNA